MDGIIKIKKSKKRKSFYEIVEQRVLLGDLATHFEDLNVCGYV